MRAESAAAPSETLSQDRKDYLLIRDAFRRFRRTMEDSAESWEAMEDIITLRASFLIDRALTGLAMDFDTALALLRNYNDFTSERERQQRDILVAAIDNLVDFAAGEELAMMREVEELPDKAQWDDCEEVCEKYNYTYAAAENGNVEHAVLIEGAVKSIISKRYERNPQARLLCLQTNGYSCKVCGFNFGDTYGELGQDYIHVHH